MTNSRIRYVEFYITDYSSYSVYVTKIVPFVYQVSLWETMSHNLERRLSRRIFCLGPEMVAVAAGQEMLESVFQEENDVSPTH